MFIAHNQLYHIANHWELEINTSNSKKTSKAQTLRKCTMQCTN